MWSLSLTSFSQQDKMNSHFTMMLRVSLYWIQATILTHQMTWPINCLYRTATQRQIKALNPQIMTCMKSGLVIWLSSGQVVTTSTQVTRIKNQSDQQLCQLFISSHRESVTWAAYLATLPASASPLRCKNYSLNHSWQGVKSAFCCTLIEDLIPCWEHIHSTLCNKPVDVLLTWIRP